MKDPEINPQNSGHLMFDKGAKAIQWGLGEGEVSIFQNFSGRRKKVNPFLSPCTKLKSKWIEDLPIKPLRLKLMGKKVEKTLEHMGTGKFF